MDGFIVLKKETEGQFSKLVVNDGNCNIRSLSIIDNDRDDTDTNIHIQSLPDGTALIHGIHMSKLQIQLIVDFLLRKD